MFSLLPLLRDVCHQFHRRHMLTATLEWKSWLRRKEKEESYHLLAVYCTCRWQMGRCFLVLFFVCVSIDPYRPGRSSLVTTSSFFRLSLQCGAAGCCFTEHCDH